jgi:hypothetical protein
MSEQQPETPNMKFAIGTRVGKRVNATRETLPPKKGVVQEYKKTLRVDKKVQWKYVVKLDNGKIEEWHPGMVFLVEDPQAGRVSFVS